MNQALTSTSEITPAALLEKVVIGGNLASLTPTERLNYYNALCHSLGLNPLSRPFEYIVLNGKLTLYARKDCTEQLRKINEVSIPTVDREVVDGIYVCTAHAIDKIGRKDTSIGAVSIEGLKGDAKANAMMKAETKSKRRVTLSICGLGMLDETEIETIPDARPFSEAQSGNTDHERATSGIAYDDSEFRQQITAKIDKLMDLPCFSDEQRNSAETFLQSNPSTINLQKKLSQIENFVQKSSKEEAKARSKKKSEPEQQTLVEGEAATQSAEAF